MTVHDLVKIIIYPITNILTFIVNMFIKRNKNIYLFADGSRFGGNTRYLYCYLSANKDKYGLKEVVSIIRDDCIYEELKQAGYKVYKFHSLKALYYHFKAGAIFTIGGYDSTHATGKKIQATCKGYFTLGAAHINLNHGIYPAKSNNRVMKRDEQTFFWRCIIDIFQFFHGIHFFRHYFIYPGGSDEELFLCSNEYQLKYMSENWYKNSPMEYAISVFPQFDEVPFLLNSEKELLNAVKSSGKKKVILYVPTYRTARKIEYSHPLNDTTFCDYLRENNYLWLDKMVNGSSDNMLAHYYDPEYTICLDKRMDINPLVNHVDMIISDYSRAGVKGVYFNKPMIMYMPDFDYYMKYDKGTIMDYINNIPGGKAYTIPELIKCIEFEFEDDYIENMKTEYDKAKQVFFEGQKLNYDYLMGLIQRYINDGWRGSDLGTWKR